MTALPGCKGGGRHGSMGTVLSGQESNGIRLKRDFTINMLLGGACVEAWGGGGQRCLPRWTLLGSSEEEVAVTDEERPWHCYRG